MLLHTRWQILHMLLHTRWQILHMSNHSELRDLRSEGILFKNKYKFIKNYLDATNKGCIWRIQRKCKIYITISIRVLFWYLIYRHNIFKKPASFICAYFINIRFNDCVLIARIIGICSASYFEDLFSYREWKQLFTQKCATNYQTYLENQLNNFWTWNNSMLKEYHTGDSAEWIIIIWTQFGGQVLGTPRLAALKLFPETVLSSDHNNNWKWTILGTQCACLLPREDF
jgi:hypothetical protein